MVNLKGILIILLAVISLIVFGIELKNLFMALLNLKVINKHKTKKYEKVSFEGKFHIILPCYCEYEILEETIDYFNNIRKTVDNINIIIVTGNEYKNEKRIENNSYKQIKKIIDNKKINIELLFDEEEYSTKSTKLNYALKYLKDKNCLYIGVFDFDARPNVDVIKFIEDDIYNRLKNVRELPCVYQQIACITKNINENSFFSKIFSIWHYRRSLGIEGVRDVKARERYVKYCIGAGSFYFYKDIVDIGGFPIYSDDIELGYNMQLKNKKVVIVPYVNKVSAINSYEQGKNQYLRVYDGLFTSKSVLRKFMNKEKVNFKKQLSYLINNYYDTFCEMIELILALLWIIADFRIFILIYFFMLINVSIYKSLFGKVSGETIFINLFEIILAPFLNIAFRSFIIIKYLANRNKIKDLYFMSSTKNKSGE